jgi:hypothetical protein
MSTYHLQTNGLIGHIVNSYNMAQEFVGTDTTDLWRVNQLKTELPDVQHYLNTPVVYRYNEHGHRNSDSVHDINSSSKPYILVIGDSFTEGIGLAVEETYAQRLKDLTGYEVYNLGLGGTGIDVMLHNLVIWSALAVNPPARLVCQWSDIHRSMEMYPTGWNPNTLSQNQQLMGANHLSEPTPWKKTWIEQFLHSGNELNFYMSRAVSAEWQIKKLYQNSKVVNVVIPGWEVNDKLAPNWTKENKIWWTPLLDDNSYKTDFARDLQHKGRSAHIWLAEEIVKYF